MSLELENKIMELELRICSLTNQLTTSLLEISFEKDSKYNMVKERDRFMKSNTKLLDKLNDMDKLVDKLKAENTQLKNNHEQWKAGAEKMLETLTKNNAALVGEITQTKREFPNTFNNATVAKPIGEILKDHEGKRFTEIDEAKEGRR